MMIKTPLPNTRLEILMPRWPPGRYAIFKFAKNVLGDTCVNGMFGQICSIGLRKRCPTLTKARMFGEETSQHFPDT